MCQSSKFKLLLRSESDVSHAGNNINSSDVADLPEHHCLTNIDWILNWTTHTIIYRYLWSKFPWPFRNFLTLFIFPILLQAGKLLFSNTFKKIHDFRVFHDRIKPWLMILPRDIPCQAKVNPDATLFCLSNNDTLCQATWTESANMLPLSTFISLH